MSAPWTGGLTVAHRTSLEASAFPAWRVRAEDLRILEVNAAAVVRYGFSREEFAGLTLADLDAGPGDDPRRLTEGLRRHRDRTGEVLDVEVRRVEPAEGDGGELVVQAAEVTPHLRREAAARAEAERAGRLREEFFAVLGHELRTPLTPALLLVSSMVDDPATPTQLRSGLELVLKNIEREARLIDDLLDVGQLRTGPLTLRRGAVDLHDELRRAVEACRDEQAARRVRVDLRLDATRHRVDGDPSRLRQAVGNLLSNAIRFSDGAASVEIRTRNDGHEGRLIVLEVVDQGIGIPSSDLERIFGAFEASDDPSGRLLRGVGLGLTLARALIEAHGGSVDVRSGGPGQGATFQVVLPTLTGPALAPETRPEVSPKPPKAAGGPLRLLLVEDNLDTLRVLERLLRRRGYVVLTAGSLAEALAQAEVAEFDLLVSDIGLPDGSGLDLVRSLGHRGTVQAIAVSGFDTEEDRRRSLEAGFALHLAKPLEIATLDAAIRSVASNAKAPANGRSA